MTERKRRKLADALARLTASAGDIRALGDEISGIVKPDNEQKPRPLRVVAPPSSSSSAASQPKTTTAPSVSLMSLVAASVLNESKGSEDTDAQKSWRESIAKLAKEMATTDPEAHDRCSRLMRRYDSLAGTVTLYEAKLKQQSSDVVLSEKVQTRLEQEETVWEETLEQREIRVAQLRVELRELQHAGEEEEEEKDEAEVDVVMESEVAALENQGLREALALRMEEKRDIEAAIQSLRRKKRRRDGAAEATTHVGDQNAALREELTRLTAEKEELQGAIYAMEAEQEQAEAAQHDVSALKDALELSKTQRQQVQDELDKQKHFLTRLKTKMKHMVDVQLMAARDTNPPTISEEMVILHLLYERAGEMDMNELKQATTEMLATYGKTTSSAAVLRAIYSLVGSLAVHIDRSIGNGVVTSLLV